MAALLLVRLVRLKQVVAVDITLDGDAIGNPAGETIGQAREEVVAHRLGVLVFVHGVVAVAVIGDQVAEGAEELLHRVLLGVEQVGQLQRGILVRGVGGQGEPIGLELGGGAVPHGLVRGYARGGRHRDGDVLILERSEARILGPSERHAGLRGLAVAELVGIARIERLGGPVGGDQALGDELVVVLDDLLVFVGGQEALDHAVLGVEAGRGRALVEAGDDAGGVEQQHRAVVGEVAVELPDVHRDLVGLSVAVRVLGLERLEHVLQLVPRGRHLQAQLVKPGLVDEHVLASAGVGLASGRRQGVHVAFGIGGEFLRVRLLLEELLDVRHLVEILAQILEQARELRGVGGEERMETDVRDLARGQGGVLLLGPGVLADFLPFDLAVAVGLEVLGPLHVGDLVRGRPLHDQNAHDRLAVGGRGRLLAAAACSQRTQQGDGARDGARLQCGSSSHCLSFEIMILDAPATSARWTHSG
ncbi:Uncharacterised protein [Bifidobacterium longum subsp. infantis]|uniref:Uncharacterized protein n=1 Tax=Bifidobacterium longum subsp. infantis TaxID=1682 RepID=A0A564VG62_BIFLI|nr:Uncharacterised protein [Bifidobacterium longum subsp. infantis]